MLLDRLSRRGFLRLAGAAPFMSQAVGRMPVPVGLEIYTLRAEEEKDRLSTLKAVADMGYDGVEFYAPYFTWTNAYARQVRAHMDSLGIRCFSTHTARANFSAADLPRAAELNRILGSRHVVMAHSVSVDGGLDGWKRLAEELTRAHETLKPLGLNAGFHNWPTEFKPEGSFRPIDVLLANTPKDMGFQIDTGGVFPNGVDLVAFLKANPGRVRSYHLKDWAPGQKGLLIGEGTAPWKAIFDTAEAVGGVEYYLIEQEGSRFTPMETAKMSLDNYRRIRG
jgi:sugar phosphate isomerase/epimerase